MRFVSIFAVATALGLAAPVASAAAQAVSPEVGNPLKRAQSLAGSNTQGALAQINTARNAADTAAERQKVAQMAAYVYTRAGQYGQAAAELERTGAGPRQLAPYYYRAGQFDKAIAAARRAGGSDMQVVIAQSYLKQGNAQGAADTYAKLIEANGPRLEWLENMAGAQYRAGDRAGYLDTIRQIIRIDPSPTRWKALLVNLKRGDMPNEAKLALYQLMRETGNLTNPDDVQEMAKLAIISEQPGVARLGLQTAQKANVIEPSDAMTARLLEAATKRAQAAQASVSKLPRNAEGYFRAANAFFGAERYPQAASLYRRAIAANLPDADQARVLAGIAFLRANNPQAARQMFGQVGAESPFKDVAELWSLYASTQQA